MNLNAQTWRQGRDAPRMTAQIDPTQNEIRVASAGVKQITVWLGRNAKGENMIDFDKPVTVYPNLNNRPVTIKITPSAAVLLEDLYLRSDRQRLFMGKIDMNIQ